MSKSDYMPRPDPEFTGWHDNLKTQSASVGATLGITAADLAQLNDLNTTLHETIDAAADLAARARQATVEKNLARQAAEQHARAFARRLKDHPAYNAGFGEQLGIEGPEDTTDLSTAKPTLQALSLPHGRIELRFNKSKSDGVAIYSQLDGETQFTFLARDTHSPYIDTRPCVVMGKPEQRRYKAIYLLNDEEIGLFSDEVPVTCQP